MKIKEKLSKMTEASKASLFFAISSFLIKGISLVTTPIFTRIMETDQYGVVSTYNAWSLIIEVLAVIGLTSSGVINVGLNDYSEKRNEYLANVTIISNFFTVIIFGTVKLPPFFPPHVRRVVQSLLYNMPSTEQYAGFSTATEMVMRLSISYRASGAICVTLLGILMLVRDEQSENA